jgi:Tol biopolymer transport system component
VGARHASGFAERPSVRPAPRRRARAVGAVCCSVLAALVCAFPAASTTGLAREGLISFTAEVYSSEIYVMDAAGSEQRRLTTDAKTEQRWPSMSPDGSRIAFVTKRSGTWHVYVMNADGTGLNELTGIYDLVPRGGFKGYPDWSPDGTELVFSAEFEPGQADIVVHNVVTGTTRNLTKSASVDLRPRWSPDGSRVVFTSTGQGGGLDLYAIRADGTGLTQLTARPGWESEPVYSPDGSQIAFVSYPNGVPDIFVMNSDGSGLRDLTNTANVSETQPAWSAAGIGFSADHQAIPGIFVVRPDGSGLRRVTGATEYAGDSDWLADGSRLVYVSGRNARSRIGATEAFGANYRALTNGRGFDTDSSWSADGTRLAFVRSLGRAQSDVYTKTGSRVRNLTRGRGLNWSPSWSPNSKRIAFVRFESFGAQVWVMNADGSGQRPLTTRGSWNDHPSWSPDGRRIVYSARRNGNFDLYVLELVTGRERRLTVELDVDLSPAWSPDGSWIAFVAYRPDWAFSDIWVIRPNGADRHPLTLGNANKTDPAWSPTSTRIVYQHEYVLGHDTDLWLVDLSGVARAFVTGDWSELDPSWQPRP